MDNKSKVFIVLYSYATLQREYEDGDSLDYKLNYNILLYFIAWTSLMIVSHEYMIVGVPTLICLLLCKLITLIKLVRTGDMSNLCVMCNIVKIITNMLLALTVVYMNEELLEDC